MAIIVLDITMINRNHVRLSHTYLLNLNTVMSFVGSMSQA